MTGRLCTTITSSSSTSAGTTITHQTNESYSTPKNIQTVTATSEFKILSEVSPQLYQVLGYYKTAEFHLEKLETSLSGVLLLAEYDGRYSRLWTWLWKYGLSRDTFNSIHLAGDWPAISGLGRGYVLRGCTRDTPVHEELLGRKWSGRLLIQKYHKKSLLFGYFWQDIHDVIVARRRKLLQNSSRHGSLQDSEVADGGDCRLSGGQWVLH